MAEIGKGVDTMGARASTVPGTRCERQTTDRGDG